MSKYTYQKMALFVITSTTISCSSESNRSPKRVEAKTYAETLLPFLTTRVDVQEDLGRYYYLPGGCLANITEESLSPWKIKSVKFLEDGVRPPSLGIKVKLPLYNSEIEGDYCAAVGLDNSDWERYVPDEFEIELELENDANETINLNTNEIFIKSEYTEIEQ